ncbi:hydrogenase expression/formation protein [Rhodocyclus tenuis]|uniref:Hydrogenase-1 operon protein HyaF n=1 Tax=Rhodocyclus tenuis TaxID=1066 RepID=A0A840G869_RHOTE|nr:hydrogenase expression/formation protein [Rhodocyclus tenuis]MBB4248533.1 hydrogenase-1 operon protein HyaF [Rhodocyclus tenuis]
MKPFAIPVVAAPDFPAADTDLQYAPLPPLETFAMPIPQPTSAEAGAAAADLVGQLLEPMRRHAAADDSWRLDLSGVDAEVLTLVNQALGEGDVSILVAASGGEPGLRIQETAFTGLWRVRSFSADEALVHDELEIAGIPAAVRARAARDSTDDFAIGELPPGLMNAPALLFELASQLAQRSDDAPPHIINLTLLPMQPADLQVIDAWLGEGPVRMLSRGFGNCRITASRLRNLWRVQYFNSMETRILDTIEVTDMPSVALATPEDIADSAERLVELIDWLHDE